MGVTSSHQQPPASQVWQAVISNHLPHRCDKQLSATTCLTGVTSSHQQPPASRVWQAVISNHLPHRCDKQSSATTCLTGVTSSHQQPPASQVWQAVISNHLPHRCDKQSSATTCLTDVTSSHVYQLTIPLSASASLCLPTLNLLILGSVDTELREKDDINDDELLTLLNDASASSQQLLPVLLTFLLRRRVLTAAVSGSGCVPSMAHWDLMAAFSFCSQCRLSSSSLATRVYEWRGFMREDTQNVLLPVTMQSTVRHCINYCTD